MVCVHWLWQIQGRLAESDITIGKLLKLSKTNYLLSIYCLLFKYKKSININ